MLLWQFYQYNQKVSTPDPLHPTQQHFFFYPPKVGAKAAPMDHNGPFVEQTAFNVLNNSPTPATFTCRVTLKNVGHAKAVNVQVRVRPYRGQPIGDVDMGRTALKPVDDGSPISPYGQWIDFPDLPPGESSTQSATFVKQAGGNFGANPSPEISYSAEKK